MFLFLRWRIRIFKLWDKMGFHSRLVLCLSALSLFILGAGYWSIFREFERELESEFDRSLFNYSTDLLKNVELNQVGKADLPFEVIFSSEKVFPFPHGDVLVKIYRYPFRELFSFSSDREAPEDLFLVSKKIQANEVNLFFDLASRQGGLWRGVLIRVNDILTPDVYFFVAVPKKAVINQINKFRSIFLIGQVFIFLIFGVLITVLSKGLLKSLETLTASIQDMPTQSMDFQFRIPRGPPEISIFTKLFNRLLKQIQNSLVAHQDFVAHAAHQLKTPLTIAKGHLEQIPREEISNLQIREDLKVVDGEIDTMSGTVNNLLNLVQIESGFQNIKPQLIDLLDLLLFEVDRLDYLARKKSIKFHVHFEDSENSLVNWSAETDSQLLSIVFFNILENSIKYASASPIEIYSEFHQQYFLVRVRNLLPPDFKFPKEIDLLEKFVRAHSPEPGQGLGLYIVYKIANLLNIKISIRHEDNSFVVELIIPTLYQHAQP